MFEVLITEAHLLHVSQLGHSEKYQFHYLFDQKVSFDIQNRGDVRSAFRCSAFPSATNDEEGLHRIFLRRKETPFGRNPIQRRYTGRHVENRRALTKNILTRLDVLRITRDHVCMQSMMNE